MTAEKKTRFPPQNGFLKAESGVKYFLKRLGVTFRNV